MISNLGRYERFVRERGIGRVLLLELGVGEMTPWLITLPFWSMTAKLPDAHLLSVNISNGSAPLQLGSKAEAIQADLGRCSRPRKQATGTRRGLLRQTALSKCRDRLKSEKQGASYFRCSPKNAFSFPNGMMSIWS